LTATDLYQVLPIFEGADADINKTMENVEITAQVPEESKTAALHSMYSNSAMQLMGN